MDSELDPIAKHLNLLLDSNIQAAELSWFTKLLGISPLVNAHLQQEVNQKEVVSIRNGRTLKSDKSINENFDYITPEQLGKILKKSNPDFEYHKIIHEWCEDDHHDVLKGEGYQRTIEYCGDSHNLVKTILQMLPPKWDNKSSSIPFTIMLPYNNDFDIGTFENKGKGWDSFNLDENSTQKLLGSHQGQLSFLVALQLLGLSDTALNDILTQTGSIFSENQSFVSLHETYRNKSLKGYRLSPNARKDILSLINKEGLSSLNESEVIIPRFKINRKKCPEILTNLRTISGSSNTVSEQGGKTDTEFDMGHIRGAMSYLMTHSSGIAITLNIPLTDERMRLEPYSTPTLIIPKRWATTINAIRPTNYDGIKHFQEQMKHDVATELTDEDIKVLYQKFENVFSFLNVKLPRKEAEKAKKDMGATNKEFSRVILSSGFKKEQFPMRLFPNPAYPQCYPAKINND